MCAGICLYISICVSVCPPEEIQESCPLEWRETASKRFTTENWLICESSLPGRSQLESKESLGHSYSLCPNPDIQKSQNVCSRKSKPSDIRAGSNTSSSLRLLIQDMKNQLTMPFLVGSESPSSAYPEMSTTKNLGNPWPAPVSGLKLTTILPKSEEREALRDKIRVL